MIESLPSLLSQRGYRFLGLSIYFFSMIVVYFSDVEMPDVEMSVSLGLLVSRSKELFGGGPMA